MIAILLLPQNKATESNRLEQDSHVYLQEDGLELWHALLKRSAKPILEMLSLLPLLITLISAGTDILPQALRILESYILLDATNVLSVS